MPRSTRSYFICKYYMQKYYALLLLLCEYYALEITNNIMISNFNHCRSDKGRENENSCELSFFNIRTSPVSGNNFVLQGNSHNPLDLSDLVIIWCFLKIFLEKSNQERFLLLWG